MAALANTGPPERRNGMGRRSPSPTDSRASLLARFLREPLVHFLLIGLALFALADWRTRPDTGFDATRRIVLTQDDLRQLAGLWRNQWNREPTPEELRRLVDDQVREEIAFREALAAGLDRQDILVRRRLVERMTAQWAGGQDFRDPSEEELRAWYAAHVGLFTPPREASFSVLFFSDRARAGKAKEEAILARDGLHEKSDDPAVTQGLGDPSELPERVASMTPDEVAGLYGRELAGALGQGPIGAWQGPVEVAGGYALVYVRTRTPGEPAPFTAVVDDVRRAWRDARRDEDRQKAYAAARARYEVVLPKGLGEGAP